ncbi:hypothetical protein RAC79_25550, partial [Agrobacterium sp. LR_9]|uniref:hypothetical protein n=1 Tax=Agrobacterium sp. LR_9 TaxID=3055787 RepID=UPI0035C1D152
FNIPMICSSVNRERFICPSPDRNGLYQILEEVQGLRSLTANNPPQVLLVASHLRSSLFQTFRRKKVQTKSPVRQ